MRYKIYAGIDGKMDYCLTNDFDTQQDASICAARLACEKYLLWCLADGGMPEHDTAHLIYSAEEVEDE